MHIPFNVVIPSYSRQDILINKTLPLVLSWGVPQDRIYVFVVAEQYALYMDSLQKISADNVHVICGPIGLHNMRNFITLFFPENTPLLHIDDDVESLYKMEEDERVIDTKSSRRYALYKMDPRESLSWLNEAFETSSLEKASLFGVYPVKNGYFMKDLDAVTTDLRFCVGALWGIWNRRDLLINLEEKEDFERTLLAYIRDGKVIRFNRICPKTNYYKTNGGMQSRNLDRQRESDISSRYLVQRWPEYCRLYTGKKNGMVEVRLLRTSLRAPKLG